VNIDKSGSNTAAVNKINRDYKANFQIKIRQNKYLNNMIEQDHRFIKKMCKPMLWFYSLKTASSTLYGIELHNMLRKGSIKHLRQ
jgi:transposase-like protein